MASTIQDVKKTIPKDIKVKWITKEKLPLVIEPTHPGMTLNSFFDILKKEHNFFREELLKSGGLLFRNFPISNENDFSALIKSLGLGQFLDYIGGDSPRNKINDGVYTSTEAPPWLKIPLHNELSFVKNYPKHIYFYCHVAPQKDGETIIADARKVYETMDASIRKRFTEKGLKYVSRYFCRSPILEFINKYQRSHKSWMEVFETHSKKEVEKKCLESEFDFKWNKNDWLEISQTRPAILEHPQTGEKLWFNQCHLYDFNPKLLGWFPYLGAKILYFRKHTLLHEVSFANGDPIPREDLYHIMDKLDENTIAFPWQKGDVMVLDNALAMHGRAPFTGKRRILAAMTG
jgi:alpha-ketoglutarate-dependent taurine dioxygenase